MKELSLNEYLVALLRVVQDDLKSGNVDSLKELRDVCGDRTEVEIPEEIVRFLESHRTLRGHPKSRARLVERFFEDPNRVAAHLAAQKIKENRQKARRRSYKIETSSGERMPIHEWASRMAVDEVNRFFELSGSARRAHFDSVKELVRRGRTKRPPRAREEDPNNFEN